mmetsp:Transcript_63914/g.181539  ORF Transcript_63914/g.181539 Transcript_63914/m.181539 type:complete len:209 (-) Transcript_63914:37-663(-)
MDQAAGGAARVSGLNKYKLVFLGEQAVGKTSVITRFMYDTFDNNYQATIGIDFLSKTMYLEDRTVRLQLWDTAGQERFADMAASYYRVGEVCLLCFDESDLKSFDSTVWWKRKVSEHNDRCTFILVGTKEDLVSEESLDLTPITRWAEEQGIPFFPTSAKKGGASVKFLFHSVAEKCIRLSRERQLADAETVKLSSSFGKPKNQCCSP